MASESVPSRFDPRHLQVLHRAVETAEDLTARFYCIPGREWPRYPYDLVTLADAPGPEARVFADVVRLAPKPSLARSLPVRTLYRIRLRDDVILDAVHRPIDGADLFPLLLYVVVHELVHVVRFGGGFAPFRAARSRRAEEEDRVHEITRGVLRPALDESLRTILDAYGRAAARGEPAPCGIPPR